tara:strand:+ start:212 stop:670 length:459 start_codon:yes stop_codon:yes gene_type:complete
MIKQFLNLSLIFSVIYLTSCGYEPLNKTTSINVIDISDKVFSGNKSINRKIFNKLNINETNDKFGYIFKLHSESKIIILAKDNSGNATSYKTNMIIQLSLIKDEKIMKNKRFEKNFTYSNLNNKFELSKYQKQVENNMINSLVQEIRIFLDF